MFPTCSHEVPQNIPNSTLVLSHMICPKFNSQLYKMKKVGKREHICSYIATGGPNKLPLGGVPNAPNFFWLGAIKHEKVVIPPMGQST